MDCGLNGPACRPPGPLASDTDPRTSTARPPVLLIGTRIRCVPFAPRAVVGVPTVNPAGGAPPGPMFRYMRLPTRLARFTLPVPLLSCSAQITPSWLPDEASLGTSTVAVTVAEACGAKVRALLLRCTQVVISFRVCPAANLNVPPDTEAAAGYRLSVTGL